MLLNKTIKIILALCGGIFIVLQGLSLELQGEFISTIMLILLTILYLKWTTNRSRYFLWFLITFSSAHILGLISFLGPKIPENSIDYNYYITNLLYIISYIFLIIKIALSIDVKAVFKELKISILILILLDVFCVVLVTETTKEALSLHEYALEFIYNAVIMALLSVALIDYMMRNDNKSMLFLLASICIVFSEIMQLAYYYVLANDASLGFVYAFFQVLAFLFFYLQSQIQFTGPEPEYMDEQLET